MPVNHEHFMGMAVGEAAEDGAAGNSAAGSVGQTLPGYKYLMD